ncbi:MAG: hypothetical protein P4M14_07360 [Gammaproteobacteria bacterium]|nr:hypothetical protein [Gammaproteobacteria bacterium]
MQSVLEHLVNKIDEAEIDPLPSENIYIENIFTPQIYAEILARLPKEDEYDFIEHPDAVLPDGRKTRKLLDLTETSIARLNQADHPFWQQMQSILVSRQLQLALLNKFKYRINRRFGPHWPELVTVPIFYRDYPGYRISEHTDAPFKVITMQFYLPKDELQKHLGTSFHLKDGNHFPVLKTNSFKPNSAYAFVRTDESWHSVKQMGAGESIRDSLALTIYEKGYEYKSNKGYR